MPRVDSLGPIAGSAPPRRARNKKPPPRQDRLSQRALFFRRVRKSLRPGLWILAAGGVFVVISELYRTLPAVLPAAPASAPAAAPVAAAAPASWHRRFGPAALLADLGLRISKVEVTGASSLDPALLDAAIGVKPGDPAFGFSLAALQGRVAQLGPVQSVTVERILPDRLVINVVARDPLAIWQTMVGGKPQFVLIDKDGAVITNQDAAAAKRREPSLLLLSGQDAPQFADALLDELKTAPTVLTHVSAAQRVDGLRWNLILKNQTVVKLPSQDQAGAIGQLAALQASMQLLDRPVEDLDLRQPNRLVVRPYAPPVPPTPADAKKAAAQKSGTQKPAAVAATVKTEPNHE
jgi:cell division protein FtsQ